MNKEEIHPPRLAEKILKKLLRRDIANQRIGDYDEVFKYHVEDKGKFFANRWYWSEILKSLPMLILNLIYWRGEMFRNYLKIAYRNIIKNKVYSFINIAGLSIGLASAFLILLWVNDEMSFDDFHKKGSDIYHVYLEVRDKEGSSGSQPTVSFEVTKMMEEKYPEVIEAVRLLSLGERVLKYEDKIFVENNGLTTDPEIFDVFTFPFVKGNPATALNDPNSIVLTESMARKYFGASDPIGKIIRFNTAFDMKVTGIIQDIPDNSYLQFDYLVPDSFKKNIGYDITYEGDYFDHCEFFTFVLMQKNFSISEFNKKFADEIYFNTGEIKGIYKIIPLKETYSFSKYNGQEVYYLFITIAFLIVILAAINFVNLTTARSTTRLKEIGIRKVSGALKGQLLSQLLSESILLSVLSYAIGMFLVGLALPMLNEITQKHLKWSHISYEIIIAFLFISVLTGLLSGLYPAYVISSFNPVNIIKNKLSIKGRKINIRQVLVVLQYSFTTVFFICSAVITSQFYYMINSNVGYTKENVYYFKIDDASTNKVNVITNELKQDPHIVSVASSTHLPVEINGGFFSEWGLKDGYVSYSCPTNVDYDYLKTFNLKLTEGRFFSRDYESDKINSVVINEEAAKRLGEGPYAGKQFYFEGNFYTVIGVIKNFHHTSFQNSIQPLVFLLNEENTKYVFVKIRTSKLLDGAVSATLKNITTILSKHINEYPVDLQYLDSYKYPENEVFDASRKLINYATILALIISSLGLLGLSAYMAERKKKEIGIRKVLGSSVLGVVRKLSFSFVGLIILSNFIAVPVGYFIMNDFLTDYAYKINLSAIYFIGPALFILLISLLTVVYHSLKAALSNPADIIKYE